MLNASIVHRVGVAPLQGPGYVPVDAIDGVDLAKGSRAADFKHSSKFFGQLAAYALDCGVAVDIFAAGMAAVNSPLLSKVATHSGGVLILHQSESLSSSSVPQMRSMCTNTQAGRPLTPSPDN